MGAGEPLLRVCEVVSGYDRKEIVHGVSLEVGRGEAVALLGPNGSGKSTLLKTIMNYIPPWSGCVVFAGEDVTRVATHMLARRGIAYVAQGRAVFPELTVYENLEMGAWTLQTREQRRTACERVLELFPTLGARRRHKVKLFSGGERQMVALAQSVVITPKLLVLDEPSLGLAPRVVGALFDMLGELRARLGVSVLMAEQNVLRALQSTDRACVLTGGRTWLSGPSADLLRERPLYGVLGGAPQPMR